MCGMDVSNGRRKPVTDLKLPTALKAVFGCPVCKHEMGEVKYPIELSQSSPFTYQSAPGNNQGKIDCTCPNCGEKWRIHMVFEGQIVVGAAVRTR